ncbi:MAG TPA: hypothetical protein V6C72_04695 [Chroococcales cyanobacterium]
MAAPSSVFENVKSSDSTVGNVADFAMPLRAFARSIGSADYQAAAGPMGNIEPSQALVVSAIDAGKRPEITGT